MLSFQKDFALCVSSLEPLVFCFKLTAAAKLDQHVSEQVARCKQYFLAIQDQFVDEVQLLAGWLAADEALLGAIFYEPLYSALTQLHLTSDLRFLFNGR